MIVLAALIGGTVTVADARTIEARADRTVAIIYGCHAEDDCHADYRRDGSWRIIRNGPHR